LACPSRGRAEPWPLQRVPSVGQLGSIMIPASVLMAVSLYDRASDSMCPRFFGIFRSSCFVSIRYNPHRRWQTNQVEAELALKAGCGLVAPSLDHSTFHRAWGVSCRATAQPALASATLIAIESTANV